VTHPPLVSIIVVNLDGRDHLETFLASVGRQDFPAEHLEIIVVDNGSTDGSVRHLQSAHPAVRLVENTENRGFAPAVNQGAAIAQGRYLAFLNNDMHLAPDWLTRMVAHLEAADTDVVCVGSRILDWDGARIDFVGGTMGFHGLAAQRAFRQPAEAMEGRYPSELLFACGGAMLIDRAVFLAVGGFDPDYFAYFEDVDLGWRLWVMGYRVAFCPEAVAYHRFHGTSSRFPAHQRTLLYERNAIYSIIKNYDDAALAEALPAALMLQTKRVAVRAGLKRSHFHIKGDDRRWRVPGPPPGALVKRFLRAGDELGWMAAWQRAWEFGAIALRRRVGMPRFRGGAGPVSLVATEALAGVAAVEDLIDDLPRLYEKRRVVQAARRRADHEIYPLFVTPFGVGIEHAACREAHDTLAETLGLRARFAGAADANAADPGADPQGAPAMSVVIAVDPTHPYLPGDLAPYARQTAPAASFELIVADWAEGPDQSDVIARFRASAPDGPAVRYVRCPSQGRAAIHNLALAHARGRLICFGADDYLPGETYVAAHLAFHARHPAPQRACFGAGLSPDDQRRASPFLAWLEDTGELNGVRFREPQPMHAPDYFSVANFSIKAAFLHQAGPFDERLPFPAIDDEELGYRLSRLGLQSTYVREADMRHDHVIRLADRSLQLARAGYSRAIIAAAGLAADAAEVHFRRVKRDAYRSWWRFCLRDDVDWRGAWWKWRLTRAYLQGYRHFLDQPGRLEALNTDLVRGADPAAGKRAPTGAGLT
jgi:GT2 family glycosyltransferase